MRKRDHSLKRRFPFGDFLFRSGDIRDQVEKLSEICQNVDVFGHNFFGGGEFRPNFINQSHHQTCQNLVTIAERRRTLQSRTERRHWLQAKTKC